MERFSVETIFKGRDLLSGPVKRMASNTASMGRKMGRGLAALDSRLDKIKRGVSSATAGFDKVAAVGAAVEANTPLLVMEAMKMEHTIRAPVAGTVNSFYYQSGDLVDGGAELLDFTPAAAAGDAR